MERVLLILAKNPRLGAVKTRLARTLGDAEALRIYRILLEKTRVAALGVAATRWLFYSEYVERRDNWPGTHFHKTVQRGEDLGSRMEDAFQQAFGAGAKRVLLIGSDCPDLNGPLLETAFERLDTADFVVGPALDGGYYLLGMNGPEPALFRGVAWSTDSVCAITLGKIQAAGKTYSLLPVLSDVDTEEDWRRTGYR